MPRKDLDFAAIRATLAGSEGKRYWRSLEEVADTDEFREFLHREFPERASEWGNTTSRRRFLQLMGASLALGGLNGCSRQPEEKIVPYVTAPEHIIPGKPLYFATAMPFAGSALGLLVESHMGRPTKIEGNPLHPASPATGGGVREDQVAVGATDVFAQASILSFYDPDRAQVVSNAGQISTWTAFVNQMTARMQGLRGRRGAGLRILTETVTSPTLIRQLEQLREDYPEARWHHYEPVTRDNAAAGAAMAFGRPVEPVYHFERADVVLSLDGDFLASGPGNLRNAREFMNRRNVVGQAGTPSMNRLYAVESTMTLAGSRADHRLAVRPQQVEAIARAIASRLGVDVPAPEESSLTGVSKDWIDAVVDDLQNYRVENADGEPGVGLVVAGEYASPAVHALAHAINGALGAAGTAVTYHEPIAYAGPEGGEPTSSVDSLRELVDAINDTQVDTLLIIGGNPVFNAPADFEFGKALEKVPFCVHLSLEVNETSALCDWHLPEAHYLEAWGDTRAFDGTVSFQQPLIAPLYRSKSVYEVMAVLLGESDRSGYDLVRETWQERAEGGDFEKFWEQALHDGVVPDTALPTVDVSVQANFLEEAETDAPPVIGDDSLDVVFRPDPTIWDGRFANNGWLQELPKPFTKVVWDNYALISIATAEKRGLQNGDLVEVALGDRSIEIPVWVQPGHPDGTLTLYFGYGRTHAGRIGKNVGHNVYPLRTSDRLWSATAAKVTSLGRRYSLVTTQGHFNVEGRDIVRSGTLEEYREHPEHPAFMDVHHGSTDNTGFYPPFEYNGYKWGMSINQTACIGCNACVVACQSENNIPIVGKEEVSRYREMHWLRIDTYYEGPAENPDVYYQPMLCVHCEKAPCEVVCPVAATTHSSEGLNEMTYNRCVGTRYCSNNCPYKVRRFNFLHYTEPVEQSPVLKLLQNPDVTVRGRGVMEKCTYCVQRINSARIEAETGNRKIEPDEVVTACQGACPTRAIVFGDLNQDSEAKRLKEHSLDYSVLGELNTQPRTTHLADLRNPNPRLAPQREPAGAHGTTH